MQALQKITKTDGGCFDEELGFRLKMLRQMKQLSQEELGDILGTSYQQIQKYESGKRKIPPQRLMQCANALSVPVSHLLEGSDYEERFAQFDKKIINIASAIASLPNPDIAKQVYQLVVSMNQEFDR
jgi:transcriptional regulator with XRE-family HTH domain